MKYFFVSGEASGDLHASHLIKEINAIDKNAQIEAWGGNLMEQQGAIILKHIKSLAFMGFIEVIKNLGTILKNFKLIKQQIKKFQPDVIVMVDYPGFNLRLAKWAHAEGFKIAYYISPQIWAWKEKRVHKIKKYVNEVICILPFEKDFYKKYNMNVHYVGHPLLEYTSQFEVANKNLKPIINNIALLPGSRLQEINTKLPVMLSIVKYFPNYNFTIAQSPILDAIDYESMIAPYPNIKLVQNDTYTILKEAQVAIVTSGTATLETALLGTPQVVCYIGNKVSYIIGKQLVNIKFISLVNLIANKKVVEELIQDDMNTKKLRETLEAILIPTERERIQNEYNLLKHDLDKGGASKLTAQIITKMVF
jgi:lipid-A-disaccharide synthase